MLYKKNKSDELDKSLFQNPTAEYRGAPFWSWNTKLDQKELDRQLICLKEMGFGGAHLHPRTGLETPYLSEEFMSYIKGCLDKAKQEDMQVYLYDEDRWPSGFAGGLVTKDVQYRAQYLLFTPQPYQEDEIITAKADSCARASRAKNGKLLAVYDVVLDENGCLASCRKTDGTEKPEGELWYAYLERAQPNTWHNNQTYVNTLDKAAMDRFLEVTHENYYKHIGEEFGKAVPTIFTDEPQFSHKTMLEFPKEKRDVILPWTEDFADTYKAMYGEDILANLPELIWEKPDKAVSTIRYHYHDHITERFTQAFADNIGAWCREHGIALTGHMMEEPTLRSQTAALGEAMRAYRGFELPGIDMLCDSYEYTTAKQAQSASHQFGREGVMSELYGVTSWSFDFRRHKLQGDWQAALGVTLRVPHLSWVSMKGEAKRDYPASINYQSPWYKEYKQVEDHFARVNTAMTRGKAKVRVGVVHPIESYWLHWGPNSQTGMLRDQMDERFQGVTQWLLFGGYDFDYIDESLLPSLCEKAGNPIQVGKMAYDVVVVPGCETLRATTVERLRDFEKAGGTVIVMGEAPSLVDAIPSEEGKKLAENARQIPFERVALIEALEPFRTVRLENFGGSLMGHLLYQLREDNDCQWLFVAAGRPMGNPDFVRRDGVRIILDGTYQVEEYDTMTGEVRPLSAVWEKGKTKVERIFHNQDSLLLKLTPAAAQAAAPSKVCRQTGAALRIPNRIPVTLSEPNVLMLDRAEFSLDDNPYLPAEELLRADNKLREQLHIPMRVGEVAQPWTLPPEEITHHANLRFAVESEIDVPVSLALEEADAAVVRLNGNKITAKPNGYYTDKCIGVIELGVLPKGSNVLEVSIPFANRIGLEWCYLLGDFGVRVEGARGVITAPVRELSFGDIVPQGLPFYGGNITYHLPVSVGEKGARIHLPHYRGALVAVEKDGVRLGELTFAPYDLDVPQTETLDLVLFGNRVNTFGAVHMVGDGDRFLHPGCWRSSGDGWSEEYVLQQVGILSSPEILPYE